MENCFNENREKKKREKNVLAKWLVRKIPTFHRLGTF